MTKLIVIGGNAAGMSAASQVKRLKPEWETVVFEKNNYISYAASGMHYYLEGLVTDLQDLLELTPKDAIEKRNIDLRLKHRVIKIDPEEKKILTIDQKGLKKEHRFDYLLLATGSIPDHAGLSIAKSDRIFSFKWLEDLQNIHTFIKEKQPQKAAIIGGGYIGLEMVEALNGMGLETHLIHRRESLARIFEQEVSDLLKEKMRSQGVILKLNTKIEGIHEQGGKVRVDTQNGTLLYDLVILGLGVSPNTQIAKEAGIELGIKGAIRVNNYLQTNYDYIYAAGDCTETVHRVTGKFVYSPLALKANKEGLTAGMNIAGGRHTFPGVLGTTILKFFDMGVARTGISMEEAESSFHPMKYLVSSQTKPKYYPGTTKLHTIIIADRDSGRLLGAQLVGPHDALKRIDVYATALHNKMTIEEIFDLDLAYAAPFSPVYDPVLLAARIGRKKMT